MDEILVIHFINCLFSRHYDSKGLRHLPYIVILTKKDIDTTLTDFTLLIS